MLFDLNLCQKRYKKFSLWLQRERPKLQRPLTLSEKILFSHLQTPGDPIRGTDWIMLEPDRVALQDVTAQMTLLQFMLAKSDHTCVPTTVHCDHLIRAEKGANDDLVQAKIENREVFDFLRSACERYGIGFWQPGSGIIHQVVLENYAFPGGMLLGTDSHTPNAGGLGMVAIGVGGADGVDVMAGIPWELKMPKIIGVVLKGKLHGWSSSKDVILKLAAILTVKGGTGYIIEYLGDGAETISCTGKATICNMGAEIGATCSIFPYDDAMERYLIATGRKSITSLVRELKKDLCSDEEVLKNPAKYYDKVIEIDLSTLGPHVNGPYSPDRSWPINELSDGVTREKYPEKIHVALIGSCTNSSYEDMERAASIARQAKKYGLRCQCPLTVTPGSDQIFETMKREGHLEALEAIGAQVLANACGPCIGQWKRHDVTHGEPNTIITSFNRNFSGRNDANPGTHSFVTSPELVVAFALSGNMHFNPLKDALHTPNGPLHLLPPEGLELPENGFCESLRGYVHFEGNPKAEIIIDPGSDRLAALTTFAKPKAEDYLGLRLLVKVKGKCTTDHISPAGPWLKFRGHLDHISDNLFSGAVNAFGDIPGKCPHPLTGELTKLSDAARYYKSQDLHWIAIGDDNYGEGSSREHAAMEPRHLGGVAILAKSFARIHETNLKKQGMLALTFENPEDYDRIKEGDIIDLLGVDTLTPGQSITLALHHRDGSLEKLPLQHSYNQHQIAWLTAGSALNVISEKSEKSS